MRQRPGRTRSLSLAIMLAAGALLPVEPRARFALAGLAFAIILLLSQCGSVPMRGPSRARVGRRLRTDRAHSGAPQRNKPR